MILALWACASPTLSDAPDPQVFADAGPDRTVQAGVAVALDAADSVGTVQWRSGDGRTYDERSPAVVYSEPGLYTAIVTVELEGSQDTDTTVITVHPPLVTLPAHGGWLQDGSWLSEDGNAVDGVGPACAEAPFALLGEEVFCTEDLPAGSRPSGVVEGGGQRWVSLRGTDELVRVVDGEIVERLPTNPDPTAPIAFPDGEIWTATFRSRGDVGRVGPHTLAFNPGPDTDTGSRGVPNLLTTALSPDGRSVFVGGTLSNTARGMFRDGEPLTFETTSRGFVAVVDREQGEVRRRVFDNQGWVGAVALDPLATRLYVAFPTNRTVLVLDPYSLDIVGSLLDIGHGIVDLHATEDRLWVHAALSRTVTAYALSDLEVLESFPTVSSEPLDAQVLHGKQLFHDSTPRLAKHGYLACVTCHPGGDHDGQTWDFTDRGEGLRNTISLLGRAGVGMGPVHWSGNFDEIQDFEHDIRNGQRGDGLMSDADFHSANTPLGPPKEGLSEDLDALAAYVSSLDRSLPSPFAAPDGGEVAFHAAGCAECHPAPLYTDSALDVRHDVGTLGPGSGQRLNGVLDGLDTPTLLGSWDSAPWLHDGSAATLAEAIERHEHAPSGHELTLITEFVRSL